MDSFDPPTVMQAIEVIVRYRSGLAEQESAEAIFGPNRGYQQRVNPSCKALVELGYVRREKEGRAYRYYPGWPGPAGDGEFSN